MEIEALPGPRDNGWTMSRFSKKAAAAPIETHDNLRYRGTESTSMEINTSLLARYISLFKCVIDATFLKGCRMRPRHGCSLFL